MLGPGSSHSLRGRGEARLRVLGCNRLVPGLRADSASFPPPPNRHTGLRVCPAHSFAAHVRLGEPLEVGGLGDASLNGGGRERVPLPNGLERPLSIRELGNELGDRVHALTGTPSPCAQAKLGVLQPVRPALHRYHRIGDAAVNTAGQHSCANRLRACAHPFCCLPGPLGRGGGQQPRAATCARAVPKLAVPRTNIRQHTQPAGSWKRTQTALPGPGSLSKPP